MQVTRTVNGLPVGDGEIRNHRIVNGRVIQTLYGALRRANQESLPTPGNFPMP